MTLNGFPYAAFHAPSSSSTSTARTGPTDARRDYTLGLARLLASLLPDDVAEGSISTLPLGLAHGVGRGRGRRRPARARGGRGGLAALEAETGKRIRLALEPEPGCTIETVAQAADFLAGLAPEWIGLCLDACHLAVQFEDADGALALLAEAGVPVVKAQVSSALRGARARRRGPRVPRRVRRAALPAPGARAASTATSPASTTCPRRSAARCPREDEWRVHFHVPVHAAEHTTQDELEATLAALAGGPAPLTRHFEVETYTWGVLPDGPGGDDGLVEGLAAELAWTRDRLVALGAEEIR